MVKKSAFIPVLFAVTIFLISQSLIVRQVWLQKDQVFDLSYRSVARESINEMMIKSGDSGFDKAYYIIDGVADIYLKETNWLKSREDSLKFAKSVTGKLTDILVNDQVLSDYISGRFEKVGLEKKFKYKIFVNELYLLGFDKKYHLYTASKEELTRQKSLGYIPVNSFSSEGNNFKIYFDYYIDITGKKRVLLKELSFTFLLSLISLVIIITTFVATLRNYLKEKRLSNLKTDFINNMTHELKTPLSTITVAAKTLKLEEILDNRDMILDTASMISKQSLHLNKLINLILEISMWERAQFQLDVKELDMEGLLKDITESFRKGCGSDCTFSESYNLHGVRSKIDIVYFTTMINNLLHNALKYSNGAPEIRVEAELADNIKISISDNGIGISKSDQKQIFDKFYRVSSGNIHKTKGLGLGLYYVKRIAEAHGGSVSVSSKRGKGSVFIVSIPQIIPEP